MAKIESKSYYADQLGGSWVIRYQSNGEVCCFRPDEQSAITAMDLLERGASVIKEAVPEPTIAKDFPGWVTD